MFTYLKQIAICEPIIEIVKRAISESHDLTTRSKITDVPTKEAVLRAVSVRTDVNTEEEVRAFTLEYALNGLHLSEIRTDELRVTCHEYINAF